jgi:hypothetical protein
LLSDSIRRQATTAITIGCLIGAIASLSGENPNTDTAIAFSGIIITTMVLEVLRALSRRDPTYGLSLAWKIAIAVLAVMAAGITAMAVLVLDGSDPVSELWSLLLKAGIAAPLCSAMLRSDPKG